MNPLLLAALKNDNRDRPPVWLMRQAGRYMPSYRALREKHSLKTLFFTPELAAEVTLMPVDQLGVDAAILFSDITVIALSLGLRLDFSDGPRVDPLLTPDKVPFLSSDLEKLNPIIEAIGLAIPRLSVPLIGFCGAPFTVATYLVEGGMDGAKKWAYRSPETFEALLNRIAGITIGYMQRQIEAGVAALQIFDSWASVLSKEHFRRFCVPYYKKMIAASKVPVILFLRGAMAHLDDLSELPCALSIDWRSHLPVAREKTKQVLQGNLDPDILYAPLPLIRQKGEELIASMKGDPGFIAGLGHGIKPDAPWEGVRMLVAALQGAR
jgi:uroporphyrinogen decarboxylase